MAKKLSDYFNSSMVPASGGISNGSFPTITSLFGSPSKVSLPVTGGSSYVPASMLKPVSSAGSSVVPPAPLVSSVPAKKTTMAPSASPIFTPAISTPSQAPVGPQGATRAAPANQTPVNSQYVNPDGSYKSAEQIASEIGASLRGAHGNGDVGTLAAEQFTGEPATTVDAEANARRITNARNDIAVGETDPYKAGADSGIAYTPSELSAIEKAYSGIYDPALDTALAKVNQKQQEDQIRLQGEIDANKPYTLGKDEVRYENGVPVSVGISSNTGTTGTYTRGQNAVVDAYVDGFHNGTYKASDIPDQYKDLVAQGVVQSTPAISKASNDAISVIDELSNGNQDFGAISGIQGLAPAIPGTPAAVTGNLVKQLNGILSLENRQQLKGQGAISDFEFRVLGDAVSALGIDQNGHTNLSKEEFANQLNKLKLKLQVGPTQMTDAELVGLQNKGYTPDQIREFSQSQSFSSVGNTKASTVAQGTGNRPQRNFNPGNVKSGGLADSLSVGQDDQGHLVFPDAQTGFKALAADLTAKINGGSSHLPANPTLAQLGKVYAEDGSWATKVASILGVPIDTHTKNIPLSNLMQAVATQEGFYA